MKRFKPGKSEVSLLCAFAMLMSVTTFVISSEASAKPRSERTGEEVKSRGKSRKFAQNSAPTLSGTPGATVLENSFYDFIPDASDANGDPLTFTIVNKPHWADFDSTTGALYGTPTAADVGRYASISIAVSDGQASTSLPDFTIDVTSNALGSVTLSWHPPTENTDGTPLTDLAGYRIYYSVDPQDFNNVIEIRNASVTTYVVDNLTPNIWYFAATSLNSSDVESSPSSPVSYVID
jgi:hypothetical protein